MPCVSGTYEALSETEALRAFFVSCQKSLDCIRVRFKIGALTQNCQKRLFKIWRPCKTKRPRRKHSPLQEAGFLQSLIAFPLTKKRIFYGLAIPVECLFPLVALTTPDYW